MGKERRKISENSWIVKVDEVIKRNYDLSARNPNKIKSVVYKKPEELIESVLEKK